MVDIITPFYCTLPTVIDNYITEENEANYNSFNIFCLQLRLQHELLQHPLDVEGYPLLVPKLIGNREVITVELRKNGNPVDLSPYPGTRQKLQNIVNDILANNPSAVPLISPSTSLKYPRSWLSNILPYVKIPQSSDNQENISHVINIPDNPYVDPIEAMRFFIMSDTIYVKLNPATDYLRVYNELSTYVIKTIDTYYKQGIIAVSKQFANKWGLQPYVIPTAPNYPDNIEFTDDELSNIVNQNLELYPLSGVPDIVPKNPPDISSIIQYSLRTETDGLFQAELVGEPETQVGLSGSEALQDFSRKIYVQEYEYRDSLYDTNQTGLYKPTWKDTRIAPNPIDFLMERLANVPYFRLKINANYVNYHIASKECNKLDIIPYIDGNYIHLPATNITSCQKLASVIYHALRTSTLAKVTFFAFGSTMNVKDKDLYQTLEGFTEDIDKNSAVAHYTNNDPLKPYIYTISLPITTNDIEINKRIHDKLFSKNS